MSHLQRFLLVLLFLAFLAGQFSIARIDEDLASLGALGEPRVWLVTTLAVFSLPLLGRVEHKRSPLALGEDNLVSLWLMLLFILFFYLALSALWSAQSDYAKEIVFSLTILTVLLICANTLVRAQPSINIEFFLRVFFVSSVIYALGGLAGFGRWGISGRLAFFWGGSNAYVRIVGAGAIIALYFWSKQKRRIWLVFLPLLSLTALLSGSRGGIASFLIAFLLTSFMLVRNLFKWALLATAVVLVTMIILFSTAKEASTETLFRRIPGNLQELNEAYEYSRAPWFSTSLDAFREAPVFGVGIGGLQSYGIQYSHNMVLNYAAEGGILGLILLLLTFFPLFAARRSKPTPESDVCLVLAIFILLASLFSGSYYDQRFIWLFFLFYLSVKQEHANEPAPLSY